MVVHENPGELDLRALTTFGLSAKPGSESPIGKFGTGLKYAVAVLARLGAGVTLYVGERVLRVVAETGDFRGEAHERLVLEEMVGDRVERTPLPFTTHLGEHWEPWMAYRELHCNARDEGGGTRSCEPGGAVTGEGRTAVVVDSREYEGVHHRRGDFLLHDREPDWDLGGVRVHRSPTGCFRQGVKVSDAIFYPCLLGWDVDGVDLTEDRTLSGSGAAVAEARVELALLRADDPELVETVLTARDGTFEHQCSWGVDPSALQRGVFGEVLARVAATRPGDLVPALRARAHRVASKGAPDARLTPVQAESLERAVAFLRRRGVDVGDVRVVESLGAGVLGTAYDREVVVSLLSFGYGVKTVAGTILEEHLHATRGLRDCTREFQDHLLRALVDAWEEVDGEAL